MNKLLQQPTKIASVNLRLWVGFCLLLACLVALANYLVDPYRLYARDMRVEQTKEKPRPEQYQSQIRTELAKKLPSDNLIMGNSTLEIGINPEDPALKTFGSTFNHAIAGHTIGDMHRTLDGLLSSFKPKRIIVNLAFADYIMSGAATDKERGVATPVNLTFRSLFSVDSSIASLETIFLPYRRSPQTLTAAGHNPMRDYQGHAQTSGYGVLFATANSRIENTFLTYRNGKNVVQLQSSKAMKQVDLFLKRLENENITVLFVLPPLHTNYINNIYKYGLGPTYEMWKDHLAAKIQNSGKPNQFQLLDFSCQSEATREPIPKNGDRESSMQFYWDAEHFKSSLGTEMFQLSLTAPLLATTKGKNLTISKLTNLSLPNYHQSCRDFHLK
jgi:DltD protein